MKSESELVLNALNVSRETTDRLHILANLLEKWNSRINLVSKTTLANLWSRHILDSAQIFNLSRSDCTHWVDIGSGGGFPGLVVAILAAEMRTGQTTTLIESDQRKCAFLRTVIRETGISAKVKNKRIEQTEPEGADVISARALSELTTLLEFGERHLGENGVGLFPKGVNWKKEADEARKTWSFNVEVVQSVTEPEAVILKVGDIRRV
ncbi:16S rRNA (guanine(527)-N(7))-methyltransferase RsmG [Shimia abyssi]|uniref:Ribosomal RNA small subunit methyltransferase G n=1 Tax=Shimia abyssi TaxID=1662395 RepID=A0A2P8F8B4_9RHOB|nr:16S rRNA (guanine(527)-N(7))-methyltransferase RsmG [Shimia abyssi]PSL17964.1 16S rRNA (guanine527-N7)-methyltransferase [Shimia abyssi]